MKLFATLRRFFTMELHYRKIGQGQPLVVLHGVFGSSDNLFTACRNISEQGFEVFIVDARNHGQSPRGEEFNYDVLAQDLEDFLNQHQLNKPFILGHSMGGKTVLNYSQKFNNFSKLIIVDIAAKAYRPHHNHIIEGLLAIDTPHLNSRKEAEEVFSKYVSDFGERQFVLKNLYRVEGGGFDWRLNIPVLAKNIDNVVGEIPLSKVVNEPTLIMRGSESKYVSDQSFEDLKPYYTHLALETIQGANHWIHATQPQAFVEATVKFLKA